ncbi:hypothetical protein AJ78_00855 [Emergomyces pasteurianus Ep9510]|uniref:MARVEL domain-containing protein n=1 Tax=Emergomyces pasteurianus Ep9510 TaxID=1447872 RepID=A0A1J9QG38_9EURO|nr:hypothetical protein AJ78_00855 [Emergomyces pasteurianus Ep9510]
MFGSLQFPRVKMLLHALQGFIVFLGWALTIAVFTQKGGTDGRTAYYFALCWITVPALIYLAAVPMWPRTRRFGNAYAFAAIDVLFSILWFASWIAVTSYVVAGKSANDDDDDKDDDKKNKSGCDAFKFGTPAKCNLSTGTAVLGVLIFLLFAGTSYMSIQNLIEYRRSGTMPYEGSDPTFAAHSKAAFSSNPAHDFDDEDDRDAEFRFGRRSTEANGGPSSSLGYRRDPDDEYALLHNTEADDLGGPHGTTPAPPPLYDPTRDNSASNNNNNNRSSMPLPGSGDATSYLHDYDTSYGGAYDGGSRPQATGSFHDRYADR